MFKIKGELKGINYKEGLARFRGNEQKFLSALSKFAAAQWGEDIPFEEAVLPENAADTMTRIHTMKGVAGNLSITDVFRYCTEFELTFKNGKPDRELYEAFCEAFREVKSGILGLAAEGGSEAAVKQGDKAACAMILGELRVSADSFDASACDRLIKKLREYKWIGVDEEAIKKIAVLTEDYEYDEAIEQIDNLLAKII